jgi:puromycin-sensitive aminopeptidase
MEGATGDRLPTGVRPSAYRVTLAPDLVAATFAGSVAIEVDVAAPAPTVELHALDLAVSTAEAELPDGTTVAASVTLDPARERAVLDFGTSLPAGPATLRLSFDGVLNDRLVGFYRSTFTDEAGVEHVLATTQLCMTDARRAFPCFDEPAAKATFQLTAIVPGGFAAFSNAPVSRESPLPDGRREVAFRPTMKMSSYLVALVIGPLAQSRVVDAGGVPLSVVCAPGREHLADFALEVGEFALGFFADYFGVAYPGEKVDLVGIPDFAYGAMENLGCITFRESALLVDPKTASVEELQQVALVVTHELAHMWFGDLVTFAWWEGAWLNEAFATFLEYVCSDAFRPDWRLWDRFVTVRGRGLEIDSLHTTRAIEFAVRTAAEALAMFDAITYLKGAAVLRMLEQYLGADVFRDGIRHYLAEHAYGSTVTADLWRSLEEVSGEPVGSTMDSWILQGGHPVVTSRDGVASQTPFALGPPGGDSAIGARWRVPLLVRPLDGGPTLAQLLDDDAPLAASSPALLNAGGSGVYRSHYARDELATIAGGLDALTPLERGVLLSDTWALVRSGEAEVADVLALATRLGSRVEPAAWSVVEDVLELLDRVTLDDDRAALEAATSALVAPLLNVLGWDAAADEDADAATARAIAIRCLGCVARDPTVAAEAVVRFESGAVDGDLADPVLAVVASLARPAHAEELLVRYRGAADPQAEDRYRSALAGFRDEAHAVSTFERSFELFRGQDAPFVIAELLANPAGGPAVWEALAAAWDPTIARLSAGLQAPMVRGIASFSDPALVDRVASFHATHPVDAGQRSVEQCVERMRHRAAFAQRVRPGLGDVLAAVGGRGVAS